MDISALTNISSDAIAAATKDGMTKPTSASEEGGFGSIFSTAMNMVNETNSYQNQAESAEVQFALGKSTSTHDLLVAQEKANVALQYTVAVRDKVLDAYNQIMNMQI